MHPLLNGLWLPAGVEHSIYSPRPFFLHALYFEAGSLRTDTEPQVLGLDNLGRELVLFLCGTPRASLRGPRHTHALALLEEVIPEAKPESFSLPRPRHERARMLADYFAAQPGDARPVEIVAERSAARVCAPSSVCSWRRPV